MYSVIKELKVGMLVAVAGAELPKVSQVHSIEDTRHPTLETSLVVEFLVQEKAKYCTSQDGYGHSKQVTRTLFKPSSTVTYYYM